MLSELRSERTQIEEAILVLERLARGHGKRRGDRRNGCQPRADGQPIPSLERDEWLVRRPENAWPKRNAGGGRPSERRK